VVNRMDTVRRLDGQGMRHRPWHGGSSLDPLRHQSALVRSQIYHYCKIISIVIEKHSHESPVLGAAHDDM